MDSPSSSPSLSAVDDPLQRPGSPTPPPEPMPNPEGYTFPHQTLKRRMSQSNKTPLVLVACGSFSPITVLHIRMVEVSERYAVNTDFEIVGTYLSPCSDAYGKSSLVPAPHRIAMAELAAKSASANIMVDNWETLRRDENGNQLYSPTVEVLRHFDFEINEVLGGIRTPEGDVVKARVMLLIGADLALTMGNPKVWAPADIDVLLGYYGAFVVERPHQIDTEKALEPLGKYRDNLWVVPISKNDVSSTKVRAAIRNGENAMDLPRPVFDYIKSHYLYLDEKQPAKDTPTRVPRTSHIAVTPITSNR